MTRRPGGWHERLPYLVWAYSYSHASAGPKALHRLCHELNEAGERAYVYPGWATNPDWNTPLWQGDGRFIAVYPEVVSGNPWKAPYVARWVLNVPGLLGGDREYDLAEMVFTWDERYLAGVPRLWVPSVETDIYRDMGLPRDTPRFYVGKGFKSCSVDAQAITYEMRLDRHALADALNRAPVLYSFDAASGMIWLARLCGCPVEVIPTGERYEPDGAVEEYAAQVAAFPAQLRTFIEITQRVVVPA